MYLQRYINTFTIIKNAALNLCAQSEISTMQAKLYDINFITPHTRTIVKMMIYVPFLFIFIYIYNATHATSWCRNFTIRLTKPACQREELSTEK